MGTPDLLADPDAIRVILLMISYMDAAGAEQTAWVAQGEWADPPDGPVAAPLLPLLETGLRLVDSWDPLDPQASEGSSYSEIILANNSSLFDWVGFWDSFRRASIDDREQLIYVVGWLGDGTKIEIADVIDSPFQRLVGVGAPSGGDDEICTLTVKAQRRGMLAPISATTYAPPCAVFPGTSATINYGDVWDLGTQGHIRIKFMCADVTVSTQHLLYKESGGTGFRITINPGGTLVGGIEFLILGQSPNSTLTAVNAIQSGVWYIAGFDWAATTRRIDINGAQIVLTSAITGAPTVNTTVLTEGSALAAGSMVSEVTIYSVSKSVAVAAPEIRAPVLPTEASLVAHVPHDEGVGAVVHDRKSGSVITGALGMDITLDGSAGWHLAGNLGQSLPWFIGRVPHHKLTWFDIASQIATVTASGLQFLSVLRFGYNPVSSANYSVDLGKGTLRLTTGSIPQAGAGVEALANSPWGTALRFAGATTTALATQAGPTGSRSLTCHVRIDTQQTTIRYLWGRQNSATAGCFVMRLTTGGVNRLEMVAINDGGSIFTVSSGSLAVGVRYFVAARLDTVTQRLSLWIDRSELTSVTTSGLWTTTPPAVVGVGCGPPTGTSILTGVVDEPLEWNVCLSDAALKLLHLAPATGSEAGLWYGYRLNEGTGASAASLVAGKAALTLVSPIWDAGRCAAGDLAWQIYSLAGYPDSARDPETWGAFILAQPADCGLTADPSSTRDRVAAQILHGVGARARELQGVVYVKRFEGISGSPMVSLGLWQIRSGPSMTAQAAGPAVWLWRLLCHVNNAVLPAGEVAAALLSSDPPGYVYASREGEWATARDEGIRTLPSGSPGKFPSAIDQLRTTPFFYKKDGDAEALRLRELFRDGSTPVDLQILIDVEDLAVLDEVGPIEGLESCELDDVGGVVVAINNEGGAATITLWRPGA